MITRTTAKLHIGLYSCLISLIVSLAVCPNAHAGAGSIDPSFGAAGKVVSTLTQGSDKILALVIQPDGKIVAVGTTQESPPNGPRRLTMWRHNSNGAPDLTFGTNGKVLTDFSAGSSSANAVALQSDNKIVVAGSAGELFALARYHADGSLDQSFGSGGLIAARYEPENLDTVSLASSLAIQTDGRIVIGGDSFVKNTSAPTYAADSNMALARFNSDGTPDGSFGTLGVVVADFGAFDRVDGIAIQADGKILVAGDSAPDSDGPFTTVLTRYRSDGTPDNSFGVAGAAAALPESVDVAAVALQSDGKIVVAGTSITGTPNVEDFAIARFTGDGVLDNSFGNGGITTTDFAWNGTSYTGRENRVFALAVQEDGKILVGGYTTVGESSSGNFAFARYQTTGALDDSFGSNGIVVTNVSGLGTNTFTFEVGSSSGGGLIITVPPLGCFFFSCNLLLEKFLLEQPFTVGIDANGKFIAGGAIFQNAVLVRFHGRTTPVVRLSNIGAGVGGIWSPGNVISCGIHCSAAYDPGTTVNLGWAAAGGSYFVGWSGCTPTIGGGCTLRLNSDAYVTARFEPEGENPNEVTTLPSGAVDLGYLESVFIQGGTNPWHGRVLMGKLPTGLALNGTDIVGTPLRSGRYRFTGEFTDALGARLSKKFDLTIHSLLQLPTTVLRTGKAGNNYSSRLSANGGKKPYVWSFGEGNFPPWLDIDRSSGRLFGVPTASGSFTFSLTVNDQVGQNVEKFFTLAIE